MIAAHGPRGLALAAAHGDGWSTYGGARPSPWHRTSSGTWSDQSASSPTVRRDARPGVRPTVVLLGYGTVQPLADAASYVAAVERAEAAGFDEVVVYWPDGEPGTGSGRTRRPRGGPDRLAH